MTWIKDFFRVNIRIYCRYCQEFYQEEWNRKGSCAFAPDCIKSGIDTISGMMCARCMLYHCMSDSEGDLINHPCSCSSNAAEEVSCTKRWVGLALLSLLVPCLWCYPPLKACHMIGVQCGVCGGKHKPQIWQPIKIYHHPDVEPLRKNHKSKQQARVHFQQPNLYDHRNFYHSAFNNYQHLQPSAITTQPELNNCNFF